jgi:hypothetical protein
MIDSLRRDSPNTYQDMFGQTVQEWTVRSREVPYSNSPPVPIQRRNFHFWNPPAPVLQLSRATNLSTQQLGFQKHE